MAGPSSGSPSACESRDRGTEVIVAAPPPTTPRRRPTWALWLAAAIAVIAALSPRDLWAPDEPRYGRIAHEMAEGGDLLVPRLSGLAYAEKPPLVFWLQAATEKALGGQSPVHARLPSALLAELQAKLKVFQKRTNDPWLLKWDYE